MTTAEADRLIDILDEMSYVRMDAELAARRLDTTVDEVMAAHRYDLANGREVFLARADRRRRGVVRVLQPL